MQPQPHTVAACITKLTRCATLASLLFKCYADMKKTKREKWIKGSNLTPKFNPNLSKGSNSNPNPDP